VLHQDHGPRILGDLNLRHKAHLFQLAQPRGLPGRRMHKPRRPAVRAIHQFSGALLGPGQQPRVLRLLIRVQDDVDAPELCLHHHARPQLAIRVEPQPDVAGLI
jgi:hypothetical protein